MSSLIVTRTDLQLLEGAGSVRRHVKLVYPQHVRVDEVVSQPERKLRRRDESLDEAFSLGF